MICIINRILVTLMLALPAAITAAEPSKSPTKPNIVLILIDDFGYECVTANGGQSYKTPVMDKLAATGVRFEQCHAQPLCTPTRVQLMTGMSNRRNYSNFGNMDRTQTTFGNLLKNNGYATAMAGKWQLGVEADGPKNFGFDEHCLWQFVEKGSRYKNPTLETNGKVVVFKNNEYGPDIVSDFALDFITRKKDVPFFLYYTMMLTHSPFDATPDSPDYLTDMGKKSKSKGKGDDANASKTKAEGGGSSKGDHFPDMTAYADKLIGKLIAKLDELDLRDNTLVLILGDNGTSKTVKSKFMGRDVSGGKGSATSWGTRVPGIGNWPGRAVSGKVSTDLIDTTDFLPTICEVTKTPIPDTLKIDGRSFLPQLIGEKGNPREWIYHWFGPEGGEKADSEFAHDGKYWLFTDGRFYDVEQDDRLKKPLAASALDANAIAAKAKLQDALKEFSWSRDPYFVKQYQTGSE